MLNRIFIAASVTSALLCFHSSAYADHAWGNYHWARKTSSFDLTVVNSTTADWDGYVAVALSDGQLFDWSDSSKVNLIEDPDGSTSTKDRRKCNPPDGQVRICNLAYGQNGWLGIAGIAIDTNGHIMYGYTKLNDTYFAWDFYNTDQWKQSVTCQELGHDLGLGHQDEDFNNQSLLSCMDYQNPPFEYPNEHDYEQLNTIYGHTDSYNSYVTGVPSGGGSGGSSGDDGCNAPPGKGCNKSDIGQRNAETGWGMSLGRRGQSETFLRIDADGTRHVTHVLWVDESHAP